MNNDNAMVGAVNGWYLNDCLRLYVLHTHTSQETLINSGVEQNGIL